MPETVPLYVIVPIQIVILICGLVLRGQSDLIRSAHHAGMRPVFSHKQTYLALGLLVAATGFIPLFLAAPVWVVANMLLLFLAAFFLVRGALSYGGRNPVKFGNRKHRNAALLRLVGTAMLFTPIFIVAFPFGLLLLVPLFIGLIFNIAARRRMDQGAVLWTMALSLRSGSNLIEDLEAVANSVSIIHRGKVMQLTDRLFEGCTPDDALRRTPGVVPHDAMIAARAGARNGTLAESLRDAAVRHTHRYEQSTGLTASPSLAVLYLTAVPLLGILILSGVMIYIIPKFKEIFEGFNTNLPDVTIRLIDFSDWMGKYWYLLSPVFLLGLAGAVLLAFGYVIGFNEFDVPVFKSWLKRLSLPNLLRVFASTVRQERPLDETVDTICSSHTRSAVRRSMDEVYHMMRSGEDPWQAMRSQKLLTQNETAALQSAQWAGNLPWALEQLAESLERRFVYRWKTWLEFLQPAIVLVIGTGVGFMIIALFVPLIKLLFNLQTEPQP